MYRTIFLFGLSMLIGGCAGWGPSEKILEAQRQHDTLSALCYNSAEEVVERKASAVNALYFSPRSEILGDYGFELFYGSIEPRNWGSASVQKSSPSAIKSSSPGAYEVRYTHIPVQVKHEDKTLTFHGVKQEIIELSSARVIAHRENYIWGRDFNRSTFCLGANWYAGNEAFLERVLGPKYIERPRILPPEYYIKAKLLRVDDVNVTLENYWYNQENALPPGSTRDYNNRTITLPDGKFYMPSYWNNEPIPYVGTVIQPDQYVFIMLPSGHLQNWPLRQILLYFRDKQGNAIKSVFVQIPPVFDWTNGWGMRASEITLKDGKVHFSVFGKKIRADKYSAQMNEGKYLKRYTFAAQID